MKKILYSPGYGAGWATWNYPDELAKFMAEYQPLIEAIENRESEDTIKQIIDGMVEEIKEKFETDHVCILGADQLTIAVVNDRYKIEEYDGNERVDEPSDLTWW
jgi:hypothetical protein